MRGIISVIFAGMDNIIDYLKQLELSEIEVKLYLQLLKTGAISVRDLAITLGINRSTAYLYIDQLIEKELIIKIVKGSRTQIAAMPPKKMLPYLVEKKLSIAKTMHAQLPSVLKTIENAFPKIEHAGNADIKYYKGRLGAKKIYEEALSAKELRSYANITTMADKFPENTQVFSEAFNKNKAIKIFEIFENSVIAKQKMVEFQSINPSPQKYLYKFLPEGVLLSAADILIYEGNVAIINVRSQVTGVVVQDTDYYNNSKEIFDVMWKMLPEINTK